MGERMALVVALLDGLQGFTHAHQRGEGAAEAREMLREVHGLWAGTEGRVGSPVDDDRDREELALAIVRAVGEVADILLAPETSKERLAWTRANLISDLECYSDSRRMP
jgi:hypothetical protein